MNDEKRIRILQLITVAAVALFILLMIALITNLVRLAGTKSRREALEAELKTLDRQIAENDGIIEYRKTEEYVDAYAREYLDMIGEDEIAFVGR